ncbi:MAG: archaetidylserine decarboxylase [Pseudomonadota bacterium]|nr:archaetidylserine decarboxylase [Pseudomonadota bacterium]
MQKLIPTKALARLIYQISRAEQPILKDLLIKGFCSIYSINTDEAAQKDYRSFNDFFTRELKPGARPIDNVSKNICCPSDGTIAQIGFGENGNLIQAKGLSYTLNDLLVSPDTALKLSNSGFVSIYLAPHNYHRVHMPINGILEQSVHVPGKLFSVNRETTSSLDKLYVKNERLNLIFNSEYGLFALVLVGAMNVGSFSTAWSGEIIGRKDGVISKKEFKKEHQLIQFKKGDYLAHFNLGSTIVFIGPPKALNWSEELENGSVVKMGSSLGAIR